MNCLDINERFKLNTYCCSSCHEDEELGYEMCSISIDGEDVHVCCRIANAYDDKKTEEAKES